MKHKLIKTENYLLEVDDSKIKDGDWCIYKTGEIIQYLVKLNTDNLKKIVAHLPLNNSPILEGVDLLPPLEQEDDVEKLALYWYNKSGKLSPKITEITAFKSGYNKAKEKYKYTEEDIAKAITHGWDLSHYHRLNTEERLLKMQRDFIQSLSQPKMPIGFECEMEQYVIQQSMPENVVGYRCKTTTNPQGQTQWVGKYIY